MHVTTYLVLCGLVVAIQGGEIDVARGEVDLGVPVISAEHAVNDEGSEREHQCRQPGGVFPELLSRETELIVACFDSVLHTLSLRRRVSNIKPASGSWLRGKWPACWTERE